MTSDQQEAESRKYSNDVIIVLPLQSGRLAIFSAARQLHRIVDNWSQVGDNLHDLPAVAVRPERLPVPSKLSNMGINIEDFI